MTTTRPEIVLVAAMGTNRVIGVNGALPWHLPEDLRHFRRVTNGAAVIMGRKTFDSINRVPLKNRVNIVLTRDSSFDSPGVLIARDIDAALSHVAPGKVACVVGGSGIYEMFLPIADRLELTIVEATPEGDTFFPAFDEGKWLLTHERRHDRDDTHAHAMRFRTLVRKPR